MKKMLFFIPAIVFSIFYSGYMISARYSGISPIIFLWVGLFTVSGMLLVKGFFWGGLPGVLPGIHMIYMSLADTGQVLYIELHVGIIIAVFYLICCGVVYYKSRKKESQK